MWAGINMLHNGYEKLQTIKSEKEIVIDDIVNIAE